jgi:hypothetical protein
MPDSNATVLDPASEDDKLKIAVKKRNAIAVANLTIAFTAEGTMALACESVSPEWPSGLAHLIVKAMFSKCQPQDTVNRVELRGRLNKVSIKKGQDPELIFEQISAIKNQYNTSTSTVSKEDLIAVIIDAAPQEHQAVLTNEQLRLGTGVTVEHLEKAMNSHWRAIHKDGNNLDDDDNELALNVFTGACHTCKKIGHKAHQCPDKKDKANGTSNGGKHFPGKCNDCGKNGHKSSDCWQKEENKDKRPQWLKDKDNKNETNNEQVNANVNDGSRVEYLFLESEMTFPNTQAILDNPNVWIADTGATVHTSPSDKGMTEGDAATAAQNSIAVGDGTNVKASKVANVCGMMCDKCGNELHEATLQDVTHLPDGKFNLFSLSKLLKQGWKLTGDKMSIKLAKDTQEMVFDVVVPTTKGLLFAMYFRGNSEIAGAMTDIQRMLIK